MARCSLNIAHPRFRKHIEKFIKAHPEFIAQLDALCALVLKDRKLSHWVNHPMPGYPEFQGRVWKWDFKPSKLAQSGTRKGWRLFALAASGTPSEHPIPADAFFCYDKDNEPTGNPTRWIAEELKGFLAENEGDGPKTDEAFYRRSHGDGKIISLCSICFQTVTISDVEAEIQMAESLHMCPTRT